MSWVEFLIIFPSAGFVESFFDTDIFLSLWTFISFADFEGRGNLDRRYCSPSDTYPLESSESDIIPVELERLCTCKTSLLEDNIFLSCHVIFPTSKDNKSYLIPIGITTFFVRFTSNNYYFQYSFELFADIVERIIYIYIYSI